MSSSAHRSRRNDQRNGGLPGFRSWLLRDLSDFLPAGVHFPSTLLISDTHLLPSEAFYADDDPATLLTVLRWLEGFQVVVLGDLTESLPLSETELHSFGTSLRLRAILLDLASRSRLRIVPGNHDRHALQVLRDLFGAGRIHDGGFRCGRILFVHGHERGLDLSPLANPVGQIAIPLAVTLKRLGLRLSFGEVANTYLTAGSRRRGEFMIFGHTHEYGISPSFMNLGSFLRRGRQTFATIEGNVLIGWERWQ